MTANAPRRPGRRTAARIAVGVVIVADGAWILRAEFSTGIGAVLGVVIAAVGLFTIVGFGRVG